MPALEKSIQKSRKPRSSKSTFNEDRLEELIIRYQNAYSNENFVLSNDVFELICKVYDPLSFTHKWFPKYRHLYEDSLDDFETDFLKVFHNTLVAWKPRHLRKESRFGGKGDFKNFFWSALSNYFINIVKSEASCKRNTVRQCPICDTWCSPISTHIITVHADLLWDHLAESGNAVNDLKSCPCCKTYKRTRVFPCEHNPTGCDECLAKVNTERLKKHILSAHSNLLFDRFTLLYPDCLTLSSKPISESIIDDSDVEGSIYDMVPAKNAFSNLMYHSMTPIQETLINRILNGYMDITYDHSLYKCSQEDFEKELDDLRAKMMICGLTE